MARPKLGETETERLHMKITAEELAAIEDWRYANRVPSKSEAVRRLVQIGLGFDVLAEEIEADSIALVNEIATATDNQLKKGVWPSDPDKAFMRQWGTTVRTLSKLLRAQRALAIKIASVSEPTREMRQHESFVVAMKKANEALDAIQKAADEAERKRNNRDLDDDIPF